MQKHRKNHVPLALRDIDPTAWVNARYAPSQAKADKIIARHAEALRERKIIVVAHYDPDSRQSQNQKQKPLLAMSEHTKRISNPTPVGHRTILHVR